MRYINITTDEYPLVETQIRLQHPNVSFPVPFDPGNGYALVQDAPRPEHNPVIQYVVEIAPVLLNGHWTRQWEVRSLFVEWSETVNGEVVVHTVAEQVAAALLADQVTKITQIQTSIVEATQKRLDDFARTRNYDGILSACTYATSAIPKFQTEGQYCVNARDATWATLYQILADVQAGTHTMPAGYADIEPDLPVLAWPA